MQTVKNTVSAVAIRTAYFLAGMVFAGFFTAHAESVKAKRELEKMKQPPKHLSKEAQYKVDMDDCVEAGFRHYECTALLKECRSNYLK